MNEELRDEVAGVLGEHREDPIYPDTCICETDIPDFLDNHFATHLAQALMPLLERREREAGARALREAADDLDALLRKAAEHLGREYRPAVPDWLRDRADATTEEASP